MWEPYFTQIIEDAFEAAKEKEETLSLRTFAKRLGLSASVLSEILRGKRGLVPQRAMLVAERAGVPTNAQKRLRRMIESLEDETADRSLLQGDAIELIMNPAYYALLSALEVLPVPCPITELSAFLNVGREDIEQIVERLSKHNVVEREDENVYWWGRHVTTTADVPNESIRSFHRDNLSRTIEMLDTVPLEQRELTTITFAASEARLPLAKAEIRKFRDALATNMHGKKTDRVYQLSIQLVPVSEAYKGERK